MITVRERLKTIVRQIENSPFTIPAYYVLNGYHTICCHCFRAVRVAPEDCINVERNVTFIFKSFNRQRLARQAYRSIRNYYPNVRVVVADDSEVPLQLEGAEVVHLPFNSGVSKGIIAALEKVQTPFVMRLDDDAVLTPYSRVHEQLAFLQRHPEVDLCGIQASVLTERSAARYAASDMGKPLIIPAGTIIDGREVVAKTSNWFLAKAEAVRKVGYDPNIRMLDHYEFFYRAAGQIVCVQDPNAFAYHCHNRFDWKYRPYRKDWKGDARYIWAKQHASRE